MSFAYESRRQKVSGCGWSRGTSQTPTPDLSAFVPALVNPFRPYKWLYQQVKKFIEMDIQVKKKVSRCCELSASMRAMMNLVTVKPEIHTVSP